MKTMLSKNFSLEEMYKSETAKAAGIDNFPPEEAINNLSALCNEVLQPLRNKFGKIIVTSGYRCTELNWLVGGESNSQHLKGEAADITFGNEYTDKYVYNWLAHEIEDNLFSQPLCVDQCIYYPNKRFIHISWKSDGSRLNRNQYLIKK